MVISTIIQIKRNDLFNNKNVKKRVIKNFEKELSKFVDLFLEKQSQVNKYAYRSHSVYYSELDDQYTVILNQNEFNFLSSLFINHLKERYGVSPVVNRYKCITKETIYYGDE